MTTEKKTINILGEDVTIQFTMAVEIAFEDITGDAFSLQNLDRQKNLVSLCMATIIVNNPDTKITMERFLKEITAEEYNIVTTAVVESMTAWMKIPKVLPEEDKPKEEDEQKQEDGAKN